MTQRICISAKRSPRLSWELLGVQLAREARAQEALELPQCPERHTAWILQMLRASNKGLEKPGAAVIALQQGHRFTAGGEASLDLALTGRVRPDELAFEALAMTPPKSWSGT